MVEEWWTEGIKMSSFYSGLRGQLEGKFFLRQWPDEDWMGVCAMSLARACFCSFRVKLRSPWLAQGGTIFSVNIVGMEPSSLFMLVEWSLTSIVSLMIQSMHLYFLAWILVFAAGCSDVGHAVFSHLLTYQDHRNRFAGCTLWPLSQLNVQFVQVTPSCTHMECCVHQAFSRPGHPWHWRKLEISLVGSLSSWRCVWTAPCWCGWGWFWQRLKDLPKLDPLYMVVWQP